MSPRLAALICKISLLCVLPAAVHGQGLHLVGFQGGINLATVGGSDPEAAETKTGVALGGSFTMRLNPMFAIRPELLYGQKGAKETEASDRFILKRLFRVLRGSVR